MVLLIATNLLRVISFKILYAHYRIFLAFIMLLSRLNLLLFAFIFSPRKYFEPSFQTLLAINYILNYYCHTCI